VGSNLTQSTFINLVKYGIGLSLFWIVVQIHSCQKANSYQDSMVVLGRLFIAGT